MDPDLPEPDEQRPRLGVRVRRRRALQLIAAQQAGCFTVSQAASVGLDRRARHHHLTYGNWRRTDAPDVYRLTSWPRDPLERVRAWSMATNSPLTSWSSLELLGLTVLGPRSTVELAVPSRSRRMRLAATICKPPARLRMHGVLLATPPVIVDRIPVRPAAEALCVLVMTSRSRRAALAFADELVTAGAIDLVELVVTAVDIGAPTVRDHFWDRYRQHRRGVTAA